MQSPQDFSGRPTAENQILLTSAARTVTGTGGVVVIDGYEVLQFQLDVTAAATDVGDTLDVFVQTTVDGTNWLDAVHFAQVLGNGGAKRFVSKLSASLSLTEFDAAAALGVSAVRHIFGSQWRVRWAITDADSDGSFTFSVKFNGT